MAGLCGVIGDEHHVESIASDLEWTGEETKTSFEDDRLSVVGVFTSDIDADQPVAVGDDTLLWVWGSIFGFETDDGYQPRPSSTENTATYCARLYARYGIEFVSRLNGDFVGVLYERGTQSVSIFTDRIGIRDTYYVQPDQETFVFSTAIQSLSRHPKVKPAFDPEYIVEYFTCHFRTFGVKTPLADTYLFPPAAITTINTASLESDSQQYWVPRYEPQDRPFSYFVEEFSRRFRDAVTERMHGNRQYGLLLSGGIDSRLVLAAVDPPLRENLTAYHLADWMSREARIAERSALTAGVNFELLKRDREYTERALSRNPKVSNFVGTFEQAHTEGVMDEIRGDIDEMITASFADSNFKGHSFPQYRPRIPPFGRLTLPIFKPMDSIDRYIDFWLSEQPAYLRASVDSEPILRREITPTDGGIEHHGITYGSMEELFMCGMLMPRTNGSVLFLLQSLRQHLPPWSPYIDNRLIDLYLTMPKKFFARRNIIAAAIEQLEPDLAEITYANTGLPVRYPLFAHIVKENFDKFVDKFLPPINEPPAPYMSNGPWPDHPTVIRTQSFIWEALKENEQLIRQLPFLNWEGVGKCYTDHLAGENNKDELYGLLTLLEMPVTKRIADTSAPRR